MMPQAVHLLVLIFVQTHVESVTVTTALGVIEGEVIETVNGFGINSFKGIPYAQPPTVQLRFRKPVQIQKWNGTLKATSWAPRCYYLKAANGQDTNTGPESEDCLYLNIFAPRDESREFPYPVMFWIHGGGFVSGGAVEYGIPQGIITKDVVFVSVQYRLSIMGFFATDDGMGNLGLWDQTLALQWVKDYIGAFGGDASRITVFGQGEGGASASILSISPHSSGLFHNLIAMSGAATNDWATRTGKRKEEMLLFCRDVANLLECKGTSQQIRDCLKKIPPRRIEEAHAQIVTNYTKGLIDLFYTLGPVLDGDFFPKDIRTLFKEAPKKATMAGVMDNEGYFLSLPFFSPKTHYLVEDFDAFNLENFEHKIEILLNEQSPKNADLIKQRVKDEFLHSEASNRDGNFLIRQWSEILGDWIVTREVVSENLARTNLHWPTWFYNFKHFNPAAFPEGFRFAGMAATHAGELNYIFGKPIFNSEFEFDAADNNIAITATTMWTNFAKYSNPTPVSIDGVIWEKSTNDRPLHYLNIKPRLEMITKSYITYWNSLGSHIEKGDMFKEL